MEIEAVGVGVMRPEPLCVALAMLPAAIWCWISLPFPCGSAPAHSNVQLRVCWFCHIATFWWLISSKFEALGFVLWCEIWSVPQWRPKTSLQKLGHQSWEKLELQWTFMCLSFHKRVLGAKQKNVPVVIVLQFLTVTFSFWQMETKLMATLDRWRLACGVGRLWSHWGRFASAACDSGSWQTEKTCLKVVGEHTNSVVAMKHRYI